MPGAPLSADELRLARLWYRGNDVPSREIARRLRRAKSTITRAVVQELPRDRRGRKRTLSEADMDGAVKCLEHQPYASCIHGVLEVLQALLSEAFKNKNFSRLVTRYLF